MLHNKKGEDIYTLFQVMPVNSNTRTTENSSDIMANIWIGKKKAASLRQQSVILWIAPNDLQILYHVPLISTEGQEGFL